VDGPAEHRRGGADDPFGQRDHEAAAHGDNPAVLELFPDSATVDAGRLTIGGVAASELANEHGTPLVVYCEETIRARVRAYREAAPAARIAYGTKAFPNVAVLRLLAELGVGADVSTAGELEFALSAGVPAALLVVHGNNKSDGELEAAARADAGMVVLDAPDEPARAAAAGVRTVLLRLTPGIEVDTHEAIRTGQLGSKFGLRADQARDAITAGGKAGLDVAGLHVHLGSQLRDTAPLRTTIEWLAAFSAECRAELGWTPRIVDLGGGLGVRHVREEHVPSIDEFVRAVVAELDRSWAQHELPNPELVLEPGRSLVGTAGVTLYRVGVVKPASESLTYVAVDGGVSDNPRPLLYGARYTAALADRFDETPNATFSVAGKHCESGDVLIDAVALPSPRRDEVLVVPATGAYTLGMASNYNGVPRPAAVLVRDGNVRVIRRRETVDDLLGLEA
jgi:diaminopimelate decarboxylase